MDHLVYLDHAATTAARPEVVEAMLPYFTEKYGNPSSIYSLGSETKAAITHAREIMAKSIGTTSENIYFTAGGSGQITGHLLRLLKHMLQKASISLHPRLNIMRFCIHAIIWHPEDMRSLILMSMRTE